MIFADKIIQIALDFKYGIENRSTADSPRKFPRS